MGRLPPKDRPPHPPVPRPHTGPPPSARAPRGALRPNAASHRRTPTARAEGRARGALIIRGALADAVRKGLVPRNVALIADAPRLRTIPKVEQEAWTAQQLQAFLRCAAGHHLFPALWVAANTGVRRSELLGLRWDDVDLTAATVSVNRGLVAVAYEVHESRGKTRNSRRRIDLDPTTVAVLDGWRGWQQAERAAVGIADDGWLFTDTDGGPVHPHAISQAFERIATRAAVPSGSTTCAARTPRC